jgi:DNA-binding transcriptional MerR regulator
MRSGELTAAAGVNVETLRYYERRGLLAEPQRSPGGHREYDAEAVALLRVVKAAQRLGFTLDEIAELLDTGRRRRHPTPDLQARAREKIAEVDGRIADLQRIRDGLLQVVAARCQPHQLHLPRLPAAVRRTGHHRDEEQPGTMSPARRGTCRSPTRRFTCPRPRRRKVAAVLAGGTCAACCVLPRDRG